LIFRRHYSGSVDDVGYLRDILMEVIQGQNPPDFCFQVLPGFKWEYVEVYRGLGAYPPDLRAKGFGE